jgi:hypothetical protein
MADANTKAEDIAIDDLAIANLPIEGLPIPRIELSHAEHPIGPIAGPDLTLPEESAFRNEHGCL